MSRRLTHIFLFSVALAVAVACAKDPLVSLHREYLSVPTYISVRANFCNSAPTAVKQKVKYLFIIDKSTPNQPNFPLAPGQLPNTDPTGALRYGPLVQFLNSLPTDPNLTSSFSLINFNTGAGFPSQGNFVRGFDPDKANFTSVVMSEWAGLGTPTSPLPNDAGFTDYAKALDQALTVIKNDATAESNSLVRPIVTSSYRLVFISGNLPVISSGGITTEVFATDILPRISALQALKNDPQLGRYISGVVLNTGYYFNASIIAAASKLLNDMAAAGNGQFMEFGDGENVLYGAIAAPAQNVRSVLSDVFLLNESATWWDDGTLQMDSDGDGIPDIMESQLGSNPDKADSDGNGVSDLVEYRLNGKPCQDAACSPTKRNPYAVCDGLNPVTDPLGNITYADSDHDGLNECEEFLLRSDADNFDSNGDSIPDWLAVRSGIPFIPGTQGAFAQPQGDNIWNYTKLKQDLPIAVPASKVLNFKTRVTSLTKVEALAEGDRDCYELIVKPVAVLGQHNKFKLYVIENQAILNNRPVLRSAEKMVMYNMTELTFTDGEIQ